MRRRFQDSTLSLRGRDPAAERRQAGLALMVVMVVFIVLYLVVYHLHYWTVMEEQVARIRYSDTQSHDGLYSASLFLMSILLEDLEQDAAEASEASGGGMVTAGLGAALGPGGEEGPAPPNGEAGGGSNFAPMVEATGGTAQPIKHHDYVHENLFNPSTKTIGEIIVKGWIRDNEGKLPLNRLFEIARLVRRGGEDGAARGTGGDVSEKDLLDAVAGAGDDKEAAENLTRVGRRARGQGGSRVGRRARAGEDGEAAVDPEAELLAKHGLDRAGGLEDESDLLEFAMPEQEALEDTQEILTRVIDAMIGMNEDQGYLYEENYSPGEIAADIVNYVIMRRGSDVQNIIYHPSELLNLYSVTPELYYGPQPALLPGEELEVDDFILRRDEFGDLVGQYVFDDDYVAEREEEQRRLEDFQESFPLLRDFPGMGVGRLAASSLTRDMAEPVIGYDEIEDREYILEPPLPMGLKDVFCSFSTAKINLNTAPVPVLYGLLLSLDAGDEGEADYVASKIAMHRHYYQEVMQDEEGVDRVSETPDLGQPKRQPPPEEEEGYLDPYEMENLSGLGSGYQDLETNYFTELRQIDLVDGTDRGPEDRLQIGSGVDKVSGEQDDLLQRVLNDYNEVMVFGSTYFTIELKAKAESSKMVKTGYLIVKRDTESRIMEVILWKELQ